MDYLTRIAELRVSGDTGKELNDLSEMLEKLSAVAKGDKQHPARSFAYLHAALLLRNEARRIVDETLSEIEKLKEEFGD